MCVNDVVNLRWDIYRTHTLAILGIILCSRLITTNSEESEVKKDQGTAYNSRGRLHMTCISIQSYSSMGERGAYEAPLLTEEL